MKTYNYIPCIQDTDSISFRKQDSSPFSEEERIILLDEINKLLPKMIIYEDDGYFEKVVAVKAKNYALYDPREKKEKQIKLKGSSITDPKKEPALQEMLKKILVDSLIHETEDYVEIYYNYVREALDIEDIHRWASKKSITETLLKSDRRNETKVVDALEGLDYQIGDKVYLFQDIVGERQKIVKDELVFKKDGTPTMIDNDVYKRVEQFDGSYDKWHYVKRVYNTINILAPVIDMERIEKFHLKSRRKLVEKL